MMRWLTRLFARGEPALSEAGPRDAPRSRGCTRASFRRGWSDGEFERLLLERNVVAHRATRGRAHRRLHPVADRGGEAEILSVAVAPARRGRGLARALLNLHLRRLAGLGARAVFLEVDEDNDAGAAALRARRLSRGRPPRRLLPAAGGHDRGRAGAAPRSGVNPRELPRWTHLRPAPMIGPGERDVP